MDLLKHFKVSKTKDHYLIDKEDNLLTPTTGSDMWTRVRGGSNRFPRGHVTRASDDDQYMSFDVREYVNRPLDRGYLIGKV